MRFRVWLLVLFGFVVAGCGDEHTTLVVALGDSITAGSPDDSKSRYEYWAERRLHGVRFRNCGVFGERTDQIAARLDNCAKGADVLIVQGGINDIAQMRPVPTAARHLREIVRRGKDLGLRVALVAVLPWNNGYPVATPRIRKLNRSIRALGRDEGVTVFPWYGRLEDPARPGRMKREWTIDGDHPSTEGYRRLGEAMSSPAGKGLFER
jgi:lysophospholipase L1-like esterase